MKLYDLFGYREYMYMFDQGYVRENFHPTLDLRIINYTEKAQYDNEWHEWLNETYEELDSAFALESNKISLAYSNIKWSLSESFTRKEFAKKAIKTDYPGFMFGILDGKDINPAIWKLIKPSAE